MEKLREMSVKDLISVWIDTSKPNNQHIPDDTTKWNSSIGYNLSIENIEFVISDKLQITLLECKIMLTSKKKVMDYKEKKLFQKQPDKKKKVYKRKQKKHLARLADGMGIVQTQIFNAHHAVCKLDNIIEESETEKETENNNNNNN